MKQDLIVDGVPPELDGGEDGPSIDLPEVLTWLGEGKFLIAGATVLAALASIAIALLLTPIYTARTTLLPPVSQQQSQSSSALAALGSIGALSSGLGGRTPDELYIALLRSDTVTRALDERFGLKGRYRTTNFENLRKVLAKVVHIGSDKKSGVILLEVDDKDPKFAADLANAHVVEVARLMSRLAVTDAQQRRVFFEQQLKETKENVVKAETDLRQVQEKSGVIVLDKQAEAVIASAAQLRAQIAQREVQLRVLGIGATAQNPEVLRVASELSALRGQLAKVESRDGGSAGGAVDLPVGRIPEASVDYVRARRELRLQEILLDAMVRQYELAKLDEAKEGPSLQQVDPAVPPDYKSRPARGSIVIGFTALAFMLSTLWVLTRAYLRKSPVESAERLQAWSAARQAWQLRRSVG